MGSDLATTVHPLTGGCRDYGSNQPVKAGHHLTTSAPVQRPQSVRSVAVYVASLDVFNKMSHCNNFQGTPSNNTLVLLQKVNGNFLQTKFKINTSTMNLKTLSG